MQYFNQIKFSVDQKTLISYSQLLSFMVNKSLKDLRIEIFDGKAKDYYAQDVIYVASVETDKILTAEVLTELMTDLAEIIFDDKCHSYYALPLQQEIEKDDLSKIENFNHRACRLTTDKLLSKSCFNTQYQELQDSLGSSRNVYFMYKPQKKSSLVSVLNARTAEHVLYKSNWLRPDMIDTLHFAVNKSQRWLSDAHN